MSLVLLPDNDPQPQPQGPEPQRPPGRDGVQIRRAQLRASYKVLPAVIGSGSFGTVRPCIHRGTRARRAVKSVVVAGRRAANAALLEDELAILTRLRHPHVVRAVDVVRDGRYVHIVMEHCTGGDLFQLTHESPLGEARVRRIMVCLMDAVAYLHSKDIVHRDLKADHLMFSSDDLDSDIKIIDFGVATIHKPGSPPMTALAGSLRTMAPEILQRSYDRACDLWSTGVVAYFLLTQHDPFDGQDQKEIIQSIVSGVYHYPKSAEEGVSAAAKSFIDCLIQVDTTRRMPAEIALSHPWLRGLQPGPALQPREATAHWRYQRMGQASQPNARVPTRDRKPWRRRAVLPGRDDGRYFSDDP